MTFVLIFQRVLARKFPEQRQLIFAYFESEFHGEHDGGIRFSYRQDEVRCFPSKGSEDYLKGTPSGRVDRKRTSVQ